MKRIYLYLDGFGVQCDEIVVNSHNKYLLSLRNSGNVIGSVNLLELKFKFDYSDEYSKTYTLKRL